MKSSGISTDERRQKREENRGLSDMPSGKKLKFGGEKYSIFIEI
jgi:hypothetical protein